ncbi:acyl-CoA dehydrogenase [Nocardioides sp. TRM66260-LWL]|uniref:acyl-CoA dehydrogenase family protein n=1 Tax=Nocardioides sp. TRM66260-LWL TaxID=2874478 RepID=UPI001CC5F71F|nr:acyl-CoA dehydrogenase family protein [Nocardioides sp. TRM66260-LWL]MBZ5736264.1 acyl-CoA dehydrogenase [Nocardioides sp. TRM66260-LWL]
MHFVHTTDQRDLATSLEALLAGADTVAVARAWADGDLGPGLALWRRLADQGVSMLATEASAVEVVIAFEALGRHAVPGPWVESAAYLPRALGRELDGPATVAVAPLAPRALDAHVVEEAYLVVDGVLHRAAPADGATHRSVDRTRALVDLVAGDAVDGPTDAALAAAERLAVLATSAQLLGAGERLLADTVSYVRQRRQFGREIGSYQALKHALADVRIALDFARPLVDGAALTDAPADVHAAKIATSDAAYLASRTALQLHGAIGYTQEFDLSLWLTKVRALVGAWGTPARHRAALLALLVDGRAA